MYSDRFERVEFMNYRQFSTDESVFNEQCFI